jgi:hypothetical protein
MYKPGVRAIKGFLPDADPEETVMIKKFTYTFL